MSTQDCEINEHHHLPPFSHAERATLIHEHPVVTRRFEIPTPPIKRAMGTMAHLIATYACHGTFVAPPRVGKTLAIDYCATRLQEVFPELPVVKYLARHAPVLTQRSFYADMLLQFGYGSIPRGVSTVDARNKLVRALFAAAQEKASRRLLYIGDEMQEFTIPCYSWLRDVSNELHELDVRMIAILFGQPELLHVCSSFREQDRGDILGRFLCQINHFDGIRSAVELCEVMTAYDDPTIQAYPKGSGISFTRFFLPEAVASGFRLAAHSKVAWTQFEEAAKPHLNTRALEKLSVGMEWIASTIAHVLTQHADFDRSGLRLRESDWSEAVRMSGFVSSLNLGL